MSLSLDPTNGSHPSGLDPGPAVEGFSERRASLVRRAVAQWRQKLIDVTGRNNLLRFRELKLGTVDVSSVPPAILISLLQGKPVRSSHLASEELRQDVVRRLRAVYKKAKENFEERGIDTLHLGAGLATWQTKGVAWEPNAPVFLRKA